MPRIKKEQIWKHFISNLNNKSVKCKHCQKLYTVPNVNKMEKHLIKCFKCPWVIKNQINKGSTNTAVVDNQSRQALESIESESNETSLQNAASVFEMTDEKKRYLDLLISKAIFVAGAPISMVEHPLWLKAFEELQPLYKLPTRKQISTNYLDTIYNQMEKEISNEIKSASNLHLQCDGWSNQRVEGIFNFIIAKPEPIFVRSLNTNSNRHTSEYISQEILKVINIYGPQKFSTLTGDNANNIQKAFELVRNTYSHIISTRCIAHTLNLLCEDFLKTLCLNGFMKIVIHLIKTIKKSQVLCALLSQIVKQKGSGETLKLPVKTRWGSHFNALKSLKNTKVALQTLAVHEEATISTEDKAHLLDEKFWEMIEESIKLLQPITEKIFKLEANQVNIHEVYMSFKDIKSSINFILPDLKNIITDDDKLQILSAVDRRMKNCVKPIHMAAYMLDPRTQGIELKEEEEIESLEFICNMGQSLNIDVMPDLANYRAKEGFWGKNFVWSSINDINPIVWWKGICKSKPLSTVAVRILTAPCTSAATERSFSVLGHVHNAKRNRLTTERAAKISYISYNWNLLKKHEDTPIHEGVGTSSSSEYSPLTSPANEPSTSCEPSTSYALQEFEFFDINHISYNDTDKSLNNTDTESD